MPSTDPSADTSVKAPAGASRKAPAGASRKTLSKDIVRDVAAVCGSLQRLNLATWLKLDLSMPQFRALAVVSQHPGVTVGDLGGRLSVGQSAASLLADQLVRRGLVTRSEDPADRRRTLLACTPAGESLVGELQRGKRQTVRDWLAALDDEELDVVARGLATLAAVARADLSPEASSAAPATPTHAGSEQTTTEREETPA